MMPAKTRLKPPLELLWAIEGAFSAVTVSESGVAFAPLSRRDAGLAGIAPDGRVLWTRPAKGPGVFNPQPLPGGKRLTAEGAPKFDSLSVLEADSGAVVWTGKHMEVLAPLPGAVDGIAIDWAIQWVAPAS